MRVVLNLKRMASDCWVKMLFKYMAYILTEKKIARPIKEINNKYDGTGSGRFKSALFLF
jgi:hypothetical protein